MSTFFLLYLLLFRRGGCTTDVPGKEVGEDEEMAFLSSHQDQIETILNYTKGFFEKCNRVSESNGLESHEAHSGSWFQHLLAISWEPSP